MVDGWPTLIYVIYVDVPGEKNKREFGWFVIIEVAWWFLAREFVQYKFPEHVFLPAQLYVRDMICTCNI